MIVNNHYPSFFQWVVPMVNRYYFSDGHVEEDYVTEIVAGRFSGNTELVRVDAPLVESVVGGSSRSGAFRGCSNLTSVSIPNTTSVGDYTFYGCKGLTSISLPNVTSLSRGVFEGCTSLTSVDTPNVTSIGNYAFRNCISLTSVDTPNVTSVGDYTFYGCTNLTHIYLDGYTSDATKPWTAINSAPNLKYLRIGLTSISAGTSSAPSVPAAFKAETIELPNCTSIGAYAFGSTSESKADTHIKSVIAPVCETVGQGAFQICSNLMSVNIPSATTIASDAIANCINLPSVILPSATSIGGYAFYSCVSLTSVDLPKATSINDQAFRDCSILNTLIIRSSSVATLSNTNVFTRTPFATAGSGAKIYVPSALVDSYKTATNWSEYAEFFTPLEGSPYEDPDWWKD